MRFAIDQEYRYSYTSAVSNVRQRLLMVPPDRHAGQHLLGFDVRVHGVSEHALSWQTDSFGNRVCRVEARQVDEFISFQADYRVDRTAQRGARLPFPRALFLEPTRLTTPDAQLTSIADSLRARAVDEPERAELAHEWAASAILYQLGVTGVHTPAAAALALGKGVCQDFAHLLLSVLRLLGIPARYVSGQLLGEGGTHAWVEALVNDELIAYDPTHARRARLDYVTVAVGRDYADVPPTSGVFHGLASGRLTAYRQMRHLSESDDEAVA